MTSDKEKEILGHLSEAWRLWGDLEDKHPSDLEEFEFYLHALQTLIAWRVARRADPWTWTVGPSAPNHIPKQNGSDQSGRDTKRKGFLWF